MVIPAVAMLAVVFGIGLIIILGQRAILRAGRRESTRDLVRQRWRAIAENIGFQYNEHSLDSEQQRLLAIVEHELHGEVYGDRVLVQKMSGDEHRLKCRVTFETPLALDLRLSRQHRLRKGDLQTGDATFDERFAIRGNDSVAVARLLGADCRGGLLRLLDVWDQVLVDDRGMDLRRRLDVPDPDALGQHLDNIVRVVEVLAEARRNQIEIAEEIEERAAAERR